MGIENNNRHNLLETLQGRLADIELEKKMHFEQEGKHIYSHEIVDKFEQFDDEIRVLKEKIARLQGLQ